ncbi:MAG: dihydroorotase [Fusobacteriaceae bacterium]
MLLIKNAKIVLSEEKEVVTSILIGDSGKILEIDENIEIENLESLKVIDANGNYVIPGIIDAHTHMRDPGLCYKEDFITGSKACAKGGVTTFIDMPNTIPNTTTELSLKEKKINSLNRSYVDYGFHFGGSRLDNSEDIGNVINDVASTKIFLNMSTGDMLVEDSKVVENIFNASRIISVHAEEDKVDTAIEFAKKTNKPLYLCHLSKASEVQSLEKAKKDGIKVYGEVAPHHLFLSSKDREKNEENKMLLNMKPELKTEEDCNALWEGIKNGVIDTIGTDHAPHTLEEKMSKVMFGIPGVENSLELMLLAVQDKKITLYTLIKIMSENPAKIFGIKNKGEIKVDYDGDLVIVDLKQVYTINNKTLISKCGWTPYKGMKSGGKILTTIVRGNIVYNNEEFFGPIGKEIKYIF